LHHPPPKTDVTRGLLGGEIVEVIDLIATFAQMVADEGQLSVLRDNVCCRLFVAIQSQSGGS